MKNLIELIRDYQFQKREHPIKAHFSRIDDPIMADKKAARRELYFLTALSILGGAFGAYMFLWLTIRFFILPFHGE